MLTLNFRNVCKAIARSAFIAFGLAVCAPGIVAQTSDVGHALMVQMKNGDKQYFMLADEPLITFEDYKCKIVSNELSADFEMSEIEHAKVLKLDPASVDEIESSLIVDLSDPSVVVIRGMTASGAVTLYNLSGVMLRQTSADESGAAELEVGDLVSGIYIVTTKETTFKVYK